MAYRESFGKDPLKLETFFEQSTIKYDVIDYDVIDYDVIDYDVIDYDVIDYVVTMDLRKKSFIEPAESCHH